MTAEGDKVAYHRGDGKEGSYYCEGKEVKGQK
jgi:hypothetical protein